MNSIKKFANKNLSKIRNTENKLYAKFRFE